MLFEKAQKINDTFNRSINQLQATYKIFSGLLKTVKNSFIHLKAIIKLQRNVYLFSSNALTHESFLSKRSGDVLSEKLVTEIK